MGDRSLPLSGRVKYGGGPYNLGDPDDKTLRKLERDVLIPQLRREIIRDQYCPKEIEEYEKCGCKHGLLAMFWKCRDVKYKMGHCLERWNNSEEVYQQALHAYLDERTIYRATGKKPDEREYERKLKIYKKNLEKESQQNTI